MSRLIAVEEVMVVTWNGFCGDLCLNWWKESG